MAAIDDLKTLVTDLVERVGILEEKEGTKENAPTTSTTIGVPGQDPYAHLAPDPDADPKAYEGYDQVEQIASPGQAAGAPPPEEPAPEEPASEAS